MPIFHSEKFNINSICNEIINEFFPLSFVNININWCMRDIKSVILSIQCPFFARMFPYANIALFIWMAFACKFIEFSGCSIFCWWNWYGQWIQTFFSVHYMIYISYHHQMNSSISNDAMELMVLNMKWLFIQNALLHVFHSARLSSINKLIYWGHSISEASGAQ